MTPSKKHVLKRVRFTYEVLCHLDVNTDEMELADVLRECVDGEMSGRSLSHETKMLTRHQARIACGQHGSDIEFFSLPEFDIGARVWWSDPDADASSGWYVIKTITGEIYGMTNAAGGECEALGHELSLKKPKGKK
jgi:hypothetical protein